MLERNMPFRFQTGTATLMEACFAAGIGEGDEVITTDYICGYFIRNYLVKKD
jgi:hypothetical protein